MTAAQRNCYLALQDLLQRYRIEDVQHALAELAREESAPPGDFRAAHRAACFQSLRGLRDALEAAKLDCVAAYDAGSTEAAADALDLLAAAEVCIADISASEESVVEFRTREELPE